MGSLYIQEPPTFGKVVLKTTVGNIDIELWGRETPKACRNFVQLCLENYYDGTPFHRVIKGFIAQGGDPKGDGSGGESIYGKPFKDEFHSRLRFVRRGLVAMANGGKDDNASQFFFTLGPCPELQKKNTIFGKVSGSTVFNMLKLEECLVDQDDRPLYPHKIISTEVIMNPFPDIVPRKQKETVKVEVAKSEPKKQKNYKLLSFGEEAEEDETEVELASTTFQGKSKSMHDLVNDPQLSSVSAASLYKKQDSEDAVEHLEQIRKKLRTEESDSSKLEKTSYKNEDDDENSSDDDDNQLTDERKKIRDEILMLQKELRKKRNKQPLESELNIKESDVEKDEENITNPMVAEFRQQRKVYKSKIKEIPSNKDERQKKTMEMLAKFQQKLKSVNETVNDESSENLSSLKNDKFSDEEDDNNEIAWMTHSLICSEQTVVAKDANMKSEDWYDLTDPRNPINERKRQGKKK